MNSLPGLADLDMGVWQRDFNGSAHRLTTHEASDHRVLLPRGSTESESGECTGNGLLSLEDG